MGGAFVGGAFGVCAGTAVGGSAGLIGGGAVGYYGYERRADIKGAAKRVSDKAHVYTNALKQRASNSKKYTMQRVSELKRNALQRVSESKKYAFETCAQIKTTASKPNV